MSEHRYEQLFTTEANNLVDIPKEDFVEFGLIVRDTKAKSVNYNKTLVDEIKNAIGTKKVAIL